MVAIYGEFFMIPNCIKIERTDSMNMKHFKTGILTHKSIILIPLLGLLTGFSSAYGQAKECSPRNGLPNWFSKLNEGAAVRIGYLGGSITCQPGYRVLSREWFQQQFPEATVSEIDAGIGGTGSELGAYRLQQDMLVHKPDLLFIEFAVNDLGRSTEDIIKSMEGIVRQTWNANPETDICFLYTFSEPNLPSLKNNQFPAPVQAMEQVAAHYGIPSIHMGLHIVKLIQAGKVSLKDPGAMVDDVAGDALNALKSEQTDLAKPIPFSKDGVHPYVNTGHQLYMDAIERSMQQIQTINKPAEKHSLPEKLNEACLENAKILPIHPTMLSSGWTQIKPGGPNSYFLNRFQSMWTASTPGETLSFTFKGTDCMIYDLMGPDCAKVEVQLDDQPAQQINRFDPYCTYYRINTLTVGRGLTNGLHTVRIKILAEQPDRRNILAKRPANLEKFDQNPEAYDGTTWSIGGIMILGDLAEQK